MYTAVTRRPSYGPETSHLPGEYVNRQEHLHALEAPSKRPNEPERIIDIRRGAIEHSVLEDMISMLQPANGKEKEMPTLLLYDEVGLKLFEDITYLEEYYLTNAEIEVLQQSARDVASRLRPNSMIVELGSGNLRKVNILLRALEHAKKNVDYYALDLSLPELQRTLSAVPPGAFRHVRCRGLHGTYDDGLAWLKLPQQQSKPKCILSLGSSIGNFKRQAATDFLSGFASILQPMDRILIGLDACQDPERVYHAYNDRLGVTHDFIRNGLTNANRILGEEIFNTDDWTVIGEYDIEADRHQAFYQPSRDVVVRGITIAAGERVRVEESYKYNAIQSSRLWEAAGLVEGARFGTSDDQYNLHLLTRAAFPGSLDRPESYAASPVPSLEDWNTLWTSWDTVTLGMIQDEDLLSKPIKLRNALVFYVGHIPTFLDIQLTRATNEGPTEPKSYAKIFERGIDPDVDNPEHCHAHSDIPDSWPPVKEIRQFQGRVRERVRQLYISGVATSNMRVGRALWLGLEHEIMHLETLLYMLLQSEKTLPPPGAIRPNFEGLAKTASRNLVPNLWIDVPESTLTVGLNDSDKNEGPSRYFGWDNEKPARKVQVPAFVAKARPITNEEYLQYLQTEGKKGIPASWISAHESNGASLTNGHHVSSSSNGILTNGHTNRDLHKDGIRVKTVYGPVPFQHALHWPVMASYDEIAGCARYQGGRIPTADELRSIYSHADVIKKKEANGVLAKRISAVNGHLSNNGVEETPPSRHLQNGTSSTKDHPDPRPLFANLEGCNVGFRNWHPTSIADRGDKLCGHGEAGGAWEWTSSVLERHEGFQPMELYPAYTADFFDGKHNIMLGGSWATHPRIAGRKTFVNWYQRNYPYVWATARIVKDA